MTNKSGNTKRAARRERAHDRRPLGSRFQDTNRQTRAGGGLPEGEEGVEGCCLPAGITHDLVLLFDLPARKAEREERLLEMHGGDVNKTLHDVCREGGGKDARFLLAHGADSKSIDGLAEEKMPALPRAALNGHLAVVEALLEAGAGDQNAIVSSALAFTSEGGHTAVAALLLSRGADVHYRNDAALYSAARNGHLATVTLLLQRGATPPRRLLASVTDRGHHQIAALLRAHGAV